MRYSTFQYCLLNLLIKSLNLLSIIGVYWSTSPVNLYAYAIGFRGRHNLQYFDLDYLYPFSRYSTLRSFVAVSTNSTRGHAHSLFFNRLYPIVQFGGVFATRGR